MIALALFEDKGRLWRGSAVRGKVDFMAVNDMWTSNLHFSSRHFVPFHNSSFVSYLNINASANDSSLSGNRASHTYGDLLFRRRNYSFFRLLFALYNMCFCEEQLRENELQRLDRNSCCFHHLLMDLISLDSRIRYGILSFKAICTVLYAELSLAPAGFLQGT